MRPFPPIAFFTLFCLGLLAVIDYVLATSTGLSGLQKTVLAGFLVAFPLLTLMIFLKMMPKSDMTQTTPFRSRNAEPQPDLGPADRMQP